MIDLSDRLAAADGISGWTATVDLPEPGAAWFHVSPTPCWEPAEGRYIVHHVRGMVDSWATGTDWARAAGLPVEIMPLTRPTGLWAGSSFAGIVNWPPFRPDTRA